MYTHRCIVWQAVPEFFDEFNVPVAKHRSFGMDVVDEVAAATDINGCRYESFVEGHLDVSESFDTDSLTKCLSERLAECYTDVFRGVMSVYVGDHLGI